MGNMTVANLREAFKNNEWVFVYDSESIYNLLLYSGTVLNLKSKEVLNREVLDMSRSTLKGATCFIIFVIKKH